MCLAQDGSTEREILKKHGYTEIRTVGEGAHGRAVLVQDAHGAQLVCKLIDVSEASKEEVETATKEAKLLASLKHPYVVRYHDTFMDSGWYGIIMDYCEGGELGDVILRRRDEEEEEIFQPIPEDQILRWITQAALALKHLHGKRILHRDIKPANFFLSKDGRNLRLGDFGIAKSLASTKAYAKTFIGTPYYLSPEVCLGKRYKWPSDIWSLGCILYELCALRVPFASQNITGLIHRIVNGTMPVVPDHYSDFVRQLCTDMMNRNPKARPSAAKILQYPEIQQVMKDMLREAQEQRHGLGRSPLSIDTAEPDEESAVQAAPASPMAAGEPAAAVLEGSPAAPAASVVLAGAAAARGMHQAEKPPSMNGSGSGKHSAVDQSEDASYRIGDCVDVVYSEDGPEGWRPSIMVDDDSEGRDRSRREWMSRREQSVRVRPRVKSCNLGQPVPDPEAQPQQRPSAPPSGMVRRQRRAVSQGPIKIERRSTSSTPRGSALPALSQSPPHGPSSPAAGVVVPPVARSVMRLGPGLRRSSRSIDSCGGAGGVGSPTGASETPSSYPSNSGTDLRQRRSSCPALKVDSREASPRTTPMGAESRASSKDTFGGHGVVRRLPSHARLGLGDPFARPSLAAAAARMISGN